MTEIKIRPEELERIANNFKNAAGEAQNQVNRLEGDINSLHGQWSGATQDKFRAEFDNSKQKMQQYIPILEKISTDLRKIAENFRNTDNSY
ncbi:MULTISPECIES: WXG100 family type VII secretion target [Bacillus cereus group]|uniref:WXG100 family type VII secretion target n=1 Tax=Bacillus cereus group TaxID=86661 RepID=UPI000278F081|nr:WXG100 family type VII secretion target [Bacillus mycoides]EJQ51597.1 WXG100 family type VII secretion target [Bacillus cereus BAG6X1-2]AIW85455.1 WXG100 type VII secretion target family protein [Bacillus mycoides]TKI42084.1 WXG100 family type VII secretion target [Bacillus mycoides]SCM94286.1 WXG100 family type VII secretion target [Bacillus mycoides]GAE38662.1 hypothetical protein BW1_009_00030 [Bacillus mycoides NBRC 101238 = DSM 11821]